MERSFSVRAVTPGLFIGFLINLSNTYYGLQTGVGSQMAMVSGLLGFVLFKLFSRYTTVQLTAAENVLIVSVATATGCMPITAGFTGVIPALEYVIGPEENGPFRIAWQKLVLWSLGLCFFGLIFASLLRDHFVVRERLPWPGPKATAHLINTLHKKTEHSSNFACHALGSDLEVETITSDPNESTIEDHTMREDPNEWNVRMKVLLQSSVMSGIIVRQNRNGYDVSLIAGADPLISLSFYTFCRYYDGYQFLVHRRRANGSGQPIFLLASLVKV
jgi:hypothetical protein